MTNIHIIQKQVEMLKKEKVEWAERVAATEPVQEEAEQEEQTEEVMSDDPSLLQSEPIESEKS